jgi:hypothetical protein
LPLLTPTPPAKDPLPARATAAATPLPARRNAATAACAAPPAPPFPFPPAFSVALNPAFSFTPIFASSVFHTALMYVKQSTWLLTDASHCPRKCPRSRAKFCTAKFIGK